MSDVGNFLGKVAGKVMNAANGDRKLKCYDCEEITPHISISYADVFHSYGDDNILASSTGVYMDLVPGIAPIGLGNPYACSHCQRIRMEGGALSNKWNR